MPTKNIHIHWHDASEYPIKLEIELSNWADLRFLIAFLKYIRSAANAGHSFMIEADREEPMQEFVKKYFGDDSKKVEVYIDGDGADKIGRIRLNGREVK